MLDDFIKQLLLWKWFIITAVTVVLCLTVLLSVMTRRFDWNKKTRGVYACFFQRTDRELAFLALTGMQFLFVLSGIVFQVEMEVSHLAGLLLMAVFKLILLKRPELFLQDCLNSVLLFLALLVVNVLTEYIRDTRFNWMIVTVLVMLGVFLVVYSAYFMVKDVVTTERKGKKKDEPV